MARLKESAFGRCGDLRRDSLRFPLTLRAKTGGKGIRTPDFQLAKLALYQLSYAPGKSKMADCRWQIVDCRLQKAKFRRSIFSTSYCPSPPAFVFMRFNRYVLNATALLCSVSRAL